MNAMAVSLLVFFAVTFVVLAVWLVRRDLAGAASPDPASQVPRLRRLKPAAEPANPGPVAAFDGWFARLLVDAGLDWNPTAAAAVVVLFSIVCGAMLFFWDERLLPAVATGALAVTLPFGFLVIRRDRRLRKLQDQLPPALETLARSIRAGQTLEQSIALLGEHSPEPLGGEFRWCARQMEMGLALPAVMQSLVQRVRVYDAQILATTLIVHRQTGGNVVNVLERLARVIRDRLNCRRQVRATTAAGRMSAGLVGLVGPCVLAYFFFFRPDYINPMLQSSLGQSMLALAIVLEIVGLTWTARLLKPAY